MSDSNNWTPVQAFNPPAIATAEGITAQEPSSTDSWLRWTQIFSMLDGTARLIHIYVPNTALQAAMLALHTSLQEVNKEFINAINDINDGKVPSVVITPKPIPDWEPVQEPQSKNMETLQAAWEIIRPGLEMAITTCQGKGFSPQLIIAINGLVNSGDKAIKVIAETLDKS